MNNKLQTMNLTKAVRTFCFIFVLTGTTLQAQTKLAPPTVRTLVDTTRFKTSDVIISATRIPMSVLNAPLAVTHLEAQNFQHNRGLGLDEALSIVPGALVQSRSGNQDVRVMIRGFGARGAGERSNAGTTRGVRFLINGLPITEPDGRTSLDLIDLSNATSIEVVRSNISALWGNASGGVVSISTVPRSDVTSAEVQNTIGSYGLMKQSVRMQNSFANSTLYCSVNNTTFDGWREHSGSSLFQMLAGIQSTLSPGTTLGVTAMAASNFYRIPGPLTEEQFNENPEQAQADTTVYMPGYVQRDERRYNRVGRIAVTLSHALADEHSLACAVYAEPKYLQRSERNTFRDFNRYHIGANAVYSYTAEWSASLLNHLQIGMDEQYQDGAILFYNLDSRTLGRGTTLRDNKREGAQNLGFFLQDQLTISEKINVHIGGRYDDISYYSYSYINPKLNDERSFTQFSPKLGLSYLLMPAMSVYTQFSRGVEVPAGNETDPPSALGEDTIRTINSLLKPIQSQTLELGLKQQIIFDNSYLRTLSYDLSLYNVSTMNDLIPYRGGRFYMPAAESRRTGVELGVVADFVFGLNVMISASVSDNVLTSYAFDSLYVNANLAGHTLNLSDNKMPGIPGTFVTTRIRYTPAFYKNMFVEGEYRMVGEYFVNDVNTTSATSFSIMDIAAGVSQPLLGGLGINALVRLNNLSDARYISSVWLNPDLALGDKSPVYIEPGLARNFVASVGLKYQW